MYETVVVPGWWHTVVPVHYGWENCEPGHSFGPFVRDHYLLHFVLSGRGSFSTGGQTFSLQAGDLFVIHAGEVTTYTADEDNPWNYVWLGFRTTEPASFLSASVLHQPPVRSVFEQIRNLDLTEQADGRIFSLTYELLWKLGHGSEADQKNPNRYVTYAKTYLETNYMQPISIQGLADLLHVNRRHLTALFRKAYGQPPQEYLMQLRLEKAREFLAMGYRVTDAAAMSGFSDLSNFSKQYKRYFGCAPSGHLHG